MHLKGATSVPVAGIGKTKQITWTLAATKSGILLPMLGGGGEPQVKIMACVCGLGGGGIKGKTCQQMLMGGAKFRLTSYVNDPYIFYSLLKESLGCGGYDIGMFSKCYTSFL